MKRILSVAITLLPVLALAQEGKYTVQGQVGTLNAPAKIYLQYRLNGKNMADSAVLQGGKFTFSGMIATPASAYLLLNDKGTGMGSSRDYKSLYLEQGVIAVTSADNLANAKINGPKTNQDNERYQASLKPIYAEYEALEAKQKAATPEQQQSEAYAKENNKAEKVIEAKENAINKKFIQDNPDSYISLNALESLAYSSDYGDIAPLYNAFTPAIKQSEEGKKFGDRLPKLKAVALGVTAPEFTEADTLGKMVSLASFRGKYVLIDFWASWCGPCRHENPNVVKAYNRYKNEKFTILGVSLDRPGAKQKWMDAIHKDGLTWNHVSDLNFWNSKVADMYAVRGIPQNFLIDPNGKIIAKNLRGDDLNDKLAEIFGKGNVKEGKAASR